MPNRQPKNWSIDWVPKDSIRSMHCIYVDERHEEYMNIVRFVDHTRFVFLDIQMRTFLENPYQAMEIQTP